MGECGAGKVKMLREALLGKVKILSDMGKERDDIHTTLITVDCHNYSILVLSISSLTVGN